MGDCGRLLGKVFAPSADFVCHTEVGKSQKTIKEACSILVAVGNGHLLDSVSPNITWLPEIWYTVKMIMKHEIHPHDS